MSKHETVLVNEIPKCDFCGEPGIYDSKTTFGSWANLCEKHFGQYGSGLGLGRGQKRILRSSLKPVQGDFDVWMEQVDQALLSQAGLSSDELPDKAYRDYFDSGMSPREVAQSVLEEEFDDMFDE